jgi:proline iminopeptidase
MRLEVYNTMWGPNEMNPDGTLVDWDVRDRLGEIGVPTLVTCGRYDESTPAIARSIHDAIPGSRLEVFEDSSHLAFVEETDAYLETLAGFFAAVED